jgi:hypothetical protein
MPECGLEQLMTTIEVSSCRCPMCQQPGEPPERELHRQMILLVSRLDEQQRRWFAGVESNRVGHGGDTLLAQITGLDEATIRRGREELAASLVDRPVERVRLPGGGRPAVEKKIRPSRRS